MTDRELPKILAAPAFTLGVPVSQKEVKCGTASSGKGSDVSPSAQHPGPVHSFRGALPYARNYLGCEDGAGNKTESFSLRSTMLLKETNNTNKIIMSGSERCFKENEAGFGNTT